MTGAVQQVSQATAASFNDLLATAQVESGLNPRAGASTSSARGLFQFIEMTWLATIKQAGSGAWPWPLSGRHPAKRPPANYQIGKEIEDALVEHGGRDHFPPAR